MRGWYLWVFPLILLVASGLIYSSYDAWHSGCGDNWSCDVSPSSNINTTNPIFAIMSGNITQIYSSLKNVSLSGSAITIPIPWFSFGSNTNATIPWFSATTFTTIGSFTLPNPSRTTYDITNVPWFSLTIFSINLGTVGGGSTTIPGNTFWNWGANDWTFNWPSLAFNNFNIPWISATTKTVTVPWIDFGTAITVCGSNSCKIPWVDFSTNHGVQVPWFGSTSYNLSLTPSIISIFAGIIMLILGLGLGNPLFNINPQGSHTLTIVGFSVLIWTFATLFLGTWLPLLDTAFFTGATAIVSGLLEFLFVLGRVLSIESSSGAGL